MPEFNIPKLENIVGKDNLRPVMKYVYVTKKKIVATNAHVLVYIKTSHVFDDNFIKSIPEEGFYLTPDDWKIVLKSIYGAFKWETKNIFTVFTKKGEMVVKTKSVENIGEYPKWENVIPSKREKIEQVGLNMANMKKICSAVGSTSCSVLSLHGKNKGVLIQIESSVPLSEYGALIMPVVIK